MTTQERTRWDPHDDPVARPFRRPWTFVHVVSVVVGSTFFVLTLVAIDRPLALVAGAVLWAGCAFAGVLSLSHRMRGLPDPLNGVDPRADPERAKTLGLQLTWVRMRANALLQAGVAVLYAVVSAVDADRRSALLVAAAIVLGLAVLLGLVGLLARRAHRRRTTALTDA